jgi:Ni/Fe-hydrogenase 1 B-type cytochrome subunit
MGRHEREGFRTAPEDEQGVFYVYEAPVRLWHWINAGSVVALAVTGLLIAHPFPSLMGEASHHFLMGDVRFVHFVAAWLFGGGFLIRLLWTLEGNAYSRELFHLPLKDRSWWGSLGYEARWNLFLEERARKYYGHNPMAQLAMFFFFVLGSLLMILTGGALYAEGLGDGSWADRLFGWVTPLVGQPQDLRTLHHLGMWLILVFVAGHIYMAVREDIVGRQTSVGTMISGFRIFRK